MSAMYVLYRHTCEFIRVIGQQSLSLAVGGLLAVTILLLVHCCRPHMIGCDMPICETYKDTSH